MTAGPVLSCLCLGMGFEVQAINRDGLGGWGRLPAGDEFPRCFLGGGGGCGYSLKFVMFIPGK